MTAEEFDKIMVRRLGLIEKTLASKAEEYADSKDRLHNFKLAAAMQGITPAESARGMMVKHWVSVLDIVRQHALDGKLPPPALLDEKIGDAVNYLILLEAILKETRA